MKIKKKENVRRLFDKIMIEYGIEPYSRDAIIRVLVKEYIEEIYGR